MSETPKPDRSPSRPSWGIPLALGVVWLAGGAFFVGYKAATDSLPLVLLGTMRFAGTALLLLPFAAWLLRTPAARPSVRQLGSAAISGVVLLAVSQTVTGWGVHLLPAGVSAVFGSSSPLFLALFSWAFMRLPLNGQQLAGVGIGFGGMVLMAWSSAQGGDFHLLGATAVLVGSAAWAAGSLYGNRADVPADAIVSMTVQTLAAGAVLGILTPATGELNGFHFAEVKASAWVGLAVLVVLNTIIGFGAFVWLNRMASITLANTFNYVSPVITMVLAVWLLSEPLTWPKVCAAAVALAGVALMVNGSKEPQRGKTNG